MRDSKRLLYFVSLGVFVIATPSFADFYDYRDTFEPVSDPVWDTGSGTVDWLLYEEDAFGGWHTGWPLGGMSPGWTSHIGGNSSRYVGFDDICGPGEVVELTLAFYVIDSYDGAWSPDELGDSWISATWGYRPTSQYENQYAVPMVETHAPGSNLYTYTLELTPEADWGYIRVHNTSSEWIGMTWAGLTIETHPVPEPASASLLVLGLAGLVARRRFRKAR